MRERESVCVCAHVCERESVCVCVWCVCVCCVRVSAGKWLIRAHCH